jgi:putative membrane protein
MKTCNESKTHLLRVLRIGTALSTAIFAATALQGQEANPTVPQAPAAGTSSPEISHRAKEFLRFAAQANQSEIAMANVAAGKAQDSTVKDLGQMMLTDHQQNYMQLEQIAQNHAITLDAALNMMNHHAVNRLEKASAADFDRDYTTVMIKDHVHAITEFDKAVAQINEPDVKQYAQNTLPKLREHLRQSESAARAVGVDNATISTMLKGLPVEEPDRVVATSQ